jgi:hypothetical protein
VLRTSRSGRVGPHTRGRTWRGPAPRPRA